MKHISDFTKSFRKKVNSAAVKVKIEAGAAADILSGSGGESQNTSMVGGVIGSLIVVAIIIGFSTGFIQNTIIPDFKSHYSNLWS